MNSFEKYLDVLPEIRQALNENKPVVALESTILSHGMPYPENLDFAHRVEDVIRSLGAVPATCAIVKGRLKVGLTAEELEIMCRAENIGKVSRRDVAVYVALGRTGATTVASTMIIAAMAGIPVFATGAGDAFMAGLLYAYLHRFIPEHAARWALAAGIIAVTSAGTVSPGMSAELVNKILEENKL